MNPNFYLIAEPGLEADALKELRRVLPFCLDRGLRPHLLDDLSIQEEKGGILFQAPLELGLQLNLNMKSITRILIRLASFRCTEFYQLEKELSQVNLNLFLKEKIKAHLKVAASESKLGQEKRIQAVCEKVWSSKLSLTKDEGQRIYVRIQNDQATISLDTSGDALYQRGNLKLRGPAPLRENKAALMLEWMTEGMTLQEKQQLTWLDPMAGSGTLISESFNFYEKSLQREYAFESFKDLPFVLQKRTSPAYKQNALVLGKAWKSCDISAEAVQWMKKNLPSDQRVEIFQKDFFQAKSRSDYGISNEEKLFLIMNPPYGERIEIQSEQAVDLNSLLKHCLVLKPEKFAVLVPERFRPIPQFENYSLKTVGFRNGGLPVQFLIYSFKS